MKDEIKTKDVLKAKAAVQVKDEIKVKEELKIEVNTTVQDKIGKPNAKLNDGKFKPVKYPYKMGALTVALWLLVAVFFGGGSPIAFSENILLGFGVLILGGFSAVLFFSGVKYRENFVVVESDHIIVPKIPFNGRLGIVLSNDSNIRINFSDISKLTYQKTKHQESLVIKHTQGKYNLVPSTYMKKDHFSLWVNELQKQSQIQLENHKLFNSVLLERVANVATTLIDSDD